MNILSKHTYQLHVFFVLGGMSCDFSQYNIHLHMFVQCGAVGNTIPVVLLHTMSQVSKRMYNLVKSRLAYFTALRQKVLPKFARKLKQYYMHHIKYDEIHHTIAPLNTFQIANTGITLESTIPCTRTHTISAVKRIMFLMRNPMPFSCVLACKNRTLSVCNVTLFDAPGDFTAEELRQEFATHDVPRGRFLAELDMPIMSNPILIDDGNPFPTLDQLALYISPEAITIIDGVLKFPAPSLVFPAEEISHIIIETYTTTCIDPIDYEWHPPTCPRDFFTHSCVRKYRNDTPKISACDLIRD